MSNAPALTDPGPEAGFEKKTGLGRPALW